MATEVLNLDPVRKLIGQRERISKGGIFRSDGLLSSTGASADNIRHFCVGAGDLNPLWFDEDYASKGPWAGLIAPPTWLYSVDIGGPLPIGAAADIGSYVGLDGESDWAFHEVVRFGDRIYVDKYLDSVEEKETRTFGPAVFLTGVTEFYRQDDILLATLKATMIIIPRSQRDDAFAALGKLAPSEPEGELPDFALENVSRRGSDPRYWDDVEEGEEITPLSKGRLTIAEIVRWFGLSESGPLRGYQGEYPESYHYDPDKARELGFPTGFDEGSQRTTWMGQAVTDWMGDAGVLRRLTVKLEQLNFIGRETIISGKVSGKSLENDEPLVELELWAEWGDGTRYTSGQATVRLPKRSKK